LPQNIIAQLNTLPEQFASRITKTYGEGLARETQTIQQMLAGAYETQISRAEALQQMIRSDAEVLGEVTQHAKAIIEATNAVSQRLEDLPRTIISPMEERLGQVFASFGEKMNIAVQTMGEAVGTSARSTQELDTISQQLGEQFRTISTDAKSWVEAAKETTITVSSSLSATSREISNSADAFRTSLDTVGKELVGSVRESQASVVECLASLQVATEAICQLVKRVDARRELETLQSAVDRVSQLLNTDGHVTSEDAP
jgi:hypothetical protein